MRLRKNKDKMVLEYYLENRILGAYETAVTDTKLIGRMAYTCFDDEEMQANGGTISKSREMGIDGKRFRICSVFTAESGAEPVGKLLSLIDSDIEKERQKLLH